MDRGIWLNTRNLGVTPPRRPGPAHPPVSHHDERELNGVVRVPRGHRPAAGAPGTVEVTVLGPLPRRLPPPRLQESDSPVRWPRDAPDRELHQPRVRPREHLGRQSRDQVRGRQDRAQQRHRVPRRCVRRRTSHVALPQRPQGQLHVRANVRRPCPTRRCPAQRPGRQHHERADSSCQNTDRVEIHHCELRNGHDICVFGKGMKYRVAPVHLLDEVHEEHPGQRPR